MVSSPSRMKDPFFAALLLYAAGMSDLILPLQLIYSSISDSYVAARLRDKNNGNIFGGNEGSGFLCCTDYTCDNVECAHDRRASVIPSPHLT